MFSYEWQGVFRSLTFRSPFFECLDDWHQVFIVNVIIAFGRCMFFGEEGYSI
jgi:hypothetical protein